MTQSYENIRLAIADPNQMVRTGLKAALHAQGFRSITDTHSFVKLHDLIEGDSVDLVITSSELEDNNVGYLIQEMRNQRLGANPFVVVIVLLTSAEPDYVRKIIDAGADDLLLTPVVPEQLMARIAKIARHRKPFVVTHDYTGPDRRTRQRAFTGQPAALIEVPNPLKARRQDGIDGTRLQRLITETASSLNAMKIERYAVQIDWLVNHIHASVRDCVGDRADLVVHATRMTTVAEDMIRRMRGRFGEHSVATVAEFLDAARGLEGRLGDIAFAELERLHALAKKIGRGLSQAAQATA